MKNPKNTLFLILALALLSSPAFAEEPTQAPYYRVFRGIKRSDIPARGFFKQLEEVFIPALPKTHAHTGLSAYLPALPPVNMPPGFPDELALVVYDSEEAYKTGRATPAGQAYADLHWTTFDREKTKSGAAQSFTGPIDADTGYDVIGQKVNSQQGYTTLFIASRLPTVPAPAFLNWLSGLSELGVS